MLSRTWSSPGTKHLGLVSYYDLLFNYVTNNFHLLFLFLYTFITDTSGDPRNNFGGVLDVVGDCMSKITFDEEEDDSSYES